MKTVIKDNISFKKENDEIIVLLNDLNLTYIEPEIYTILTLFNGDLDDNDIIGLLKEIFNRSDKDNQIIFATLLKKFDFILDRKESTTKIREFETYIDKKRVINFQRIRSIVPVNLVVSLTRNCFMRCRYCYAGAIYSNDSSVQNSLDIDLFSKVIEEAHSLGIKHIDLTGGDPFIRKDIFKILDMLKFYGITTSLSTKKILNDYEIKKLSSYNNIFELQISLDTLNDEHQKQLILKDKYSSHMIPVIKSLIDKGLNVKVNTVITKININDVIPLTLFLNSIGVKNHILSPYSTNLWRCENSFLPEENEYKKLFNKIDTLNLDIKIDHPVLSYVEIDDNEINNMYKSKNNILCAAGLDGLIIDPNGDAYVCERLAYNKEFSLGNIKNESILNIWNSKEIKKYYMPEINFFKDTECFECEDNEYCIHKRGICYVHSLIINGKIYSPDNLCKKNFKREKRIF